MLFFQKLREKFNKKQLDIDYFSNISNEPSSISIDKINFPIGIVVTIITTIIGGVLYVNDNYAHASDFEELLTQQKKQIELYNRSQIRNTLFQLEYYDDKLKKLHIERRQAEILEAQPKHNLNYEPVRRVKEIDEELSEISYRKKILRDTIDQDLLLNNPTESSKEKK